MSPVTEIIVIDGVAHEFELFEGRRSHARTPSGLYLGFNQLQCWISPDAYRALGDPEHAIFGYDRARRFIGLAAAVDPGRGYRVVRTGARYSVHGKPVRTFLGLEHGWYEEATLSREGFLYVSYANHLTREEA